MVLFFNDRIFKETKFKHLLCTEDLTVNNVFFLSVLYTSGFPNSTCEYLFMNLFLYTVHIIPDASDEI